MLDFKGVQLIRMAPDLLENLQTRAQALDWPKKEPLTFLGIRIEVNEHLPADIIAAVYDDRIELIRITAECSDTCMCQKCTPAPRPAPDA